MKIYGSKKTSFKKVRFNYSGTRYLQSQKRENRIISQIDNGKREISNNLIPVKVNDIGRLWVF